MYYNCWYCNNSLHINHKDLERIFLNMSCISCFTDNKVNVYEIEYIVPPNIEPKYNKIVAVTEFEAVTIFNSFENYAEIINIKRTLK